MATATGSDPYHTYEIQFAVPSRETDFRSDPEWITLYSYSHVDDKHARLYALKDANQARKWYRKVRVVKRETDSE